MKLKIDLIRTVHYQFTRVPGIMTHNLLSKQSVEGTFIHIQFIRAAMTSENSKSFSIFQNSAVLSWSHGVIIVFAVDDRNSFEKVQGYIKNTREITMKNASVVIVANKVDIQDRKVSLEEGQLLATKQNCSYMEVSTEQDPHSVNSIFDNLTQDVLKKRGMKGHKSPLGIRKLFTSLSEQAGKFLREHNFLQVDD